MADKGERTMRLKFRRPSTIDGHDYQAGRTEAVKVTDSAWEAVNRGDADLDPPPGVAGQPADDEIPDWVKRDETTEAPLPVVPMATPGAVPAQPAARQPQPAGKSKGVTTPEVVHPPEPNRLDRPEDRSKHEKK